MTFATLALCFSWQAEAVPGVMLIEGGDLRIPAGAIQITLGEDGKFEGQPITPLLRTDMWPTWLMDCVDSAAEANKHHAELAAAVTADDGEEKARVLVAELRASMRALTGAAFAFDSLYAAVKARGGPHPHEGIWRAKRTARQAQIHATLSSHLGAGTNTWSRDFLKFLRQLFHARGAAVHPGSEFREPVIRPELDSGVDWHFALFRAENATTVAQGTVSVFDSLIARGGAARHPEIVEWQPAAARALAKVIAHYRSTDLPAMVLSVDATGA